MPSGSHSQTSLSLTAATVTEQTRPSTLFPRTRLRAQNRARELYEVGMLTEAQCVELAAIPPEEMCELCHGGQ